MEIGRPSNLGSLVAAVLVGLLALGANHYARLDPRQLDSLMAKFQGVGAKPEQEEPVTIGRLRHAVGGTETKLTMLYERWKRNLLPAEDARICSALDGVATWRAMLDEHPQLRDELTISDRLSMVTSLFMAAEMAPQRFGDAFSDANHEMRDVADSGVAAKVAVLEFYRAQDFSHPDLPTLLQNLQSFVSQYENSDVGVDLYLLTARELVARGHLYAAERVLQHGIAHHDGFASKSRLVNERIDLQHKTVD